MPARAVGSILGVILAGGQSRRMEGPEKGLVDLGGSPLAVHAMTRLAPQVDNLILNANGDITRYSSLGLPIVADTLPGHPGPLVGLLAAMRWTKMRATDVTHVASIPVDTPFFPMDLVDCLRAGLSAKPDARLAFAATPNGPQPVFALVACDLADELERDILSGAARRVAGWLRSQPYVEVVFDDADAFFNVNTPADLTEAHRMLAQMTS